MCTYSHLCSTSSLDYSRSNNSFPPIQVVMCSTYLKRNLFRSSTKGSVHHLRRQDTSATRNANRCLQCSRDTLIKQLGITKHTLRKHEVLACACAVEMLETCHTHTYVCVQHQSLRITSLHVCKEHTTTTTSSDTDTLNIGGKKQKDLTV